ncbi:ABC transporter substrate-binding protein [Pseudomonas sp. JR33AA]|uniref:ABC transporter substrate-binding protein n=1 Tax=Pseudomonas sp. JR33AA TaxID=2899113 RepID=UPI001F43588E|nr:ABC transporter substrate-binding protein [Pseudomonas sp. JR33AA]MCE5977680.1 ABC transporter substrate-binding protein [Pseudomonas sp. JR33AA]
MPPLHQLLAIGTLALGLTACSPADNTSISKTLNIAFWGDNTTLVSVDPFQVYWLEHRVLLRNVVESLTDQDPQTGRIIPWLAKTWEVGADALSYTFHLREDVTFSNGERFDAHAVKTAFDNNKAFASQLPATFGATYLAGYDHAEVIDDFTVRLVLAKPNAGFLQATSTTNLAILAPASYQLSAQQRSLGKIIGTGPFTLNHYTPEVGARLLKRADYAWPSANVRNQGPAYLDAVDISYIPEESVRNGLFLQGKVDILWPRNPFSEVDLKLFQSKGATIQSRSLPGPALNLYPNTRNDRLLGDRQVRLALQKAIDRTSYAHTVYNNAFPVAAESAGDVLVQDQLRKVGIDLKLNVLTRAEWVTGNSTGAYDLTSTYMTRADPIILQTILDPRAANSATLATNTYEPDTLAKAQALFDSGITATADTQRAHAYGQLQDLLVDEASAFPLYERVWQAATAPRVKHFHWTAEGFALLSDIQVGQP